MEIKSSPYREVYLRPRKGGQGEVGGSLLCGWMKNGKVEKRGREGFMPRLTLLLTVAYYGNFLKLWVGERREQCKQKTDNYWTVNRGEARRVITNARRKVNSR